MLGITLEAPMSCSKLLGVMRPKHTKTLAIQRYTAVQPVLKYMS